MKSLCQNCKYARWIANAKWDLEFHTINTEYTCQCDAPDAPKGQIEQPVTECPNHKPTKTEQ